MPVMCSTLSKFSLQNLQTRSLLGKLFSEISSQFTLQHFLRFALLSCFNYFSNKAFDHDRPPQLGSCWSVGQKNQDTFCTVQASRMLKIPHQNRSTKRFFPGRLTTQKSCLQQEKKVSIIYRQNSSLLSLKKKYEKKRNQANQALFEQIKYFGQTKYLSKSNRYCSPPNLVINPWEGVPTPRRL